MIKDNIVEAVREDLLRRSQTGIKKYGTTLDRNDLYLKDWLQHAYEECLDQANYLKKTIMMLEADNKPLVDVNSVAGSVVLNYIKRETLLEEGIISEPKHINITKN